ncbi:MAG TPA: response regulator transcription factor [Jatrophihabitans sp.]|nr:response regulator transcription factor [Jatrophihabitans sp.]
MTSHRLVLADSQLLFAEALSAALNAAGHEVLAVCRTGVELASTLSSTTASICLSDLHLADGHVADVLAHFADTRPNCRIVVLTDDARPDVLRSALDFGVAGYLQKNRGFDVLLETLARVGRGEVVVEASFVPSDTARLADSARARSLWDGLTNRELQCVQLMVEGMDTTAMARELCVSPTTVRSHVQAVLQKLGVHSRLEAAAMAARYGLVTEGDGEHGTPIALPRIGRGSR